MNCSHYLHILFASAQLFLSLVSDSSGDDAKAEKLGQTLGLDVLALYEHAADKAFEAKDYGV